MNLNINQRETVGVSAKKRRKGKKPWLRSFETDMLPFSKLYALSALTDELKKSIEEKRRENYLEYQL